MTQKQKASEPWIILPGTTVGGEVGTFSVDFVIWSRGRTQHRTLNGVVDTGACFTVVPEAILDELGIERRRTRAFKLADGSRREMSLGLVTMELEGQTDDVHVAFGLDDSTILLGALALEVFALAADAKYRQLIPAELTL
jgi:predicted aspartyl protease